MSKLYPNNFFKHLCTEIARSAQSKMGSLFKRWKNVDNCKISLANAVGGIGKLFNSYWGGLWQIESLSRSCRWLWGDFTPSDGGFAPSAHHRR